MITDGEGKVQYERNPASESIAAMAEATGSDPMALIYDALVSEKVLWAPLGRNGCGAKQLPFFGDATRASAGRCLKQKGSGVASRQPPVTPGANTSPSVPAVELVPSRSSGPLALVVSSASLSSSSPSDVPGVA